MALLLKHQTAAEFASRFWERVKTAYQNDDKVEFARLLTWLWWRVQSGDFTNDQVRLTFNAAYGRSLNTSQWNNLVTTRIIPVKDRYLAMLADGDL